MDFVKPRFWIDADSSWDLDTAAFDLINTPSSTFRTNPNSLITPDVPNGVLGAMVAGQLGNWTSTNCIYNMVPLGLFNKNSEGAPYLNNPAVGSGKMAIYMHGATLLCYLFETNATGSGGAAKTLASAYAPGSLLYCSPYSLMTNDLPTSFSGDGVNYAVGLVAATPDSVTNEMGVKLLI